MRKGFNHNQHSVYLLYYHLIMVVKYRKKVIDDNIGNNYGKVRFGLIVSV